MKRFFLGAAFSLLMLGQVTAQDADPIGTTTEEKVSDLEKKVSALNSGLKFSGYLSTAAVWLPDYETLGLPGSFPAGGYQPTSETTRLRLNMAYEMAPATLKARLQWSDLNPTPSIQYAYGSFDFLDKMLQFTLGKLVSTEFAFRYYAYEDNRFAGFGNLDRKDGVELLFKPLSGFTLGTFVPVSVTSTDANSTSFGLADFLMSYKVKDTLSVNAGYNYLGYRFVYHIGRWK